MLTQNNGAEREGNMPSQETDAAEKADLNVKNINPSSRRSSEIPKPIGVSSGANDNSLERLLLPIQNSEIDVRIERYKTRQALLALRSKRASIDLRRSSINLVIICFALLFIITTFVFASINNPDVYTVDEATLKYLSRFFNAAILLVIPFFFGSLGAFTRVLISGLKLEEHVALVGASGLISTFSWVGIKSGVLMQIVAPHLAEYGLEKAPSPNFESQFYTMVFVALLVGMFSTNVYIFVNERIELLLSKRRAGSPAE